MSDTNDDPMLAHLKARRRELATRLDGIRERLAEIDELLSVLADGRTRVRRKLKEVTLGVVTGNGAAEQPNVAPPPEAA